MSRTQESFAAAMLIRELYARCMRQVGSDMADSGLTAQQVTVIRLVAHQRSPRISDICREMALSKGTVSGILTRLEAMGLVERCKEPGDQRNTFIRFTAKGQAFAARFRGQMAAAFDHVFAGFSDGELAKARAALQGIRDRMPAEREAPGCTAAENDAQTRLEQETAEKETRLDPKREQLKSRHGWTRTGRRKTTGSPNLNGSSSPDTAEKGT